MKGMQLGFYYDQSRCIGCHTCAVACKDWNDIDAGPVFWRKVISIEEGKYPQVTLYHLSLSCLHCENPPCIPACPTGAIIKREKDGIVLVNQDICRPSCRLCLEACPYAAPQFGPEKDARMQMCNFCLDRIEKGKNPVCVDACPLRALDAGWMEELKEKYGDNTRARGFVKSAARPAVIFQTR